MHPKWKFSASFKRTIYYGSQEAFPDLDSSTKNIADFRIFLDNFLAKHGVQNCKWEEKMYNTGGHSDIDYYALVLVSDTGGCECVFYQMWGTKYEGMTPFISLYGAWIQWEEELANGLHQRYGPIP